MLESLLKELRVRFTTVPIKSVSTYRWKKIYSVTFIPCLSFISLELTITRNRIGTSSIFGKKQKDISSSLKFENKSLFPLNVIVYLYKGWRLSCWLKVVLSLTIQVVTGDRLMRNIWRIFHDLRAFRSYSRHQILGQIRTRTVQGQFINFSLKGTLSLLLTSFKPEADFYELKPRRWPSKNRFQLSAGSNLETLNTISSGYYVLTRLIFESRLKFCKPGLWFYRPL